MSPYRGVFGGGGHWALSAPCRRMGSPTPVGDLDGEGSFLISGYCALKKVNQNLHIEGGTQKRSTKVALDTDGALSTSRPLGNNMRSPFFPAGGIHIYTFNSQSHDKTHAK